jgi:hypothetical protein
MKIASCAPNEKRSVKALFKAANVSTLCITAFGRPVVLEVNMM